MFGARVEELLDAFGAIRWEPVDGYERLVTGRGDLVVGGDDAGAGRVVECGEHYKRNKALPVILCIPTGHRHAPHRAIVRATPRHPPGRNEADAALAVGVYEVLVRRVKITQGGNELGAIARAAHRKTRAHGKILLRERGPCEREYMPFGCRAFRRLDHIRDHRTVTRRTHADATLLAAHADQFIAHLEFCLPARCEVTLRVSGREALDEKILGI